MRVKKWLLLLFYVCMFGLGIYLGLSNFEKGNISWVIWVVFIIGMGYQIYRFLTNRKNGELDNDVIVADERIMRKIINSLAIAYICMLTVLIIATAGLYYGFIAGEPLNFMVGAILISLLGFMVSQIVQRFMG
ncbi:hypothetical protein [Oceanobacillus sp. FSL H7-0719]|uniref:hypothetical protein n=1 Tax=Oceanobacillus sp. FSL H7-0719 TaxID=2954507 RepID=UPI003250CBDC